MKHSLALLLALLPLAARAEVSKDDLLKMAAAGTDPALMVSLVERDCVDFEVDAEALVELAPQLPREVLQAAIDCRGLARRSEILACRIYRKIAAEPDLADFPVILGSIEKEKVFLQTLTPSDWIKSKSRKSADRPRLSAEQARKRARLKEIVESFPSIAKAVLHVHPSYTSILGLKAQQRAAVAKACTQSGGVVVESEPPGAWVWVNGEEKGKTPLLIRLLSGEYRVRVEKPTWVAHHEQVILREAETRRLRVELVRRARLEVESTPAGAIVLVDGEYEGITPLEVFVDGGEHSVELIHPRHAPHRARTAVEPGGSRTVGAELRSVPGEDYCYGFDLAGNVEANLEALAARLFAAELTLVVPLYKVVTSTMEHKQPSTHVVDAKRILFEPKLGDKYVDHPLELLGEELQGWSFGETAADLLSMPPGTVTVTQLRKRRKNTLELELRHENGETNSLFFDFTRDLGQVPVADLADAFCVAFSRHEAFAGR